MLRLVGLANPHSLVFDETFYVKDSWTLLHLGYEGAWPDQADPRFNAGTVDTYTTDPEFVAHPPLGKWIIALGLAVFGAENSLGWRVSTAVVGILAVLLVAVLARTLTRSASLGTIAGLLFAIDGNAIVMSRVALLDNSVMLLALVGFSFVLLDRAWTEARVRRWTDARTAADRDTSWGPALWNRPWLVAAGLAFGLDAGVKWSGFYFLGAFGVYVVVTDVLMRRRAGIENSTASGVLKQGPIDFVLMVPIALAAYVATWSGWLLTKGGYYRDWVQTTADAHWTGALSWVPDWAQNLWHYQAAMYGYSINVRDSHPYEASPFGWILMARPTSMYYRGTTLGQDGCGSDACSQAITGLGNPFIWWAGAAAVLYLVYRLARYREWRVGLVLTGLAAGYLPWFLYLDRTIFTFYSIVFQPYVILGLTLVIGLIVGRPTDTTYRRTRGIGIVAVFLVVCVAASIYFLPLWTGQMTSFAYWNAHIWLPGWR